MMASAMVLIPKEKWDKLQKEAKERPNRKIEVEESKAEEMREQKNDLKMSTERERMYTTRKEPEKERDYEVLVARLVKELKGIMLPANTHSCPTDHIIY